MTLAYVFWHSRRSDISEPAYRAALEAFHTALRSSPPAGFLRSQVFRVSSVPWLVSEHEAYEDWYLLENSAAIDPLNSAAVSSPRQHSHDTVARMAANGTAGLYLLRQGELPAAPVHIAYWFAKPGSDSYPALYDRLAPQSRSGALWGRQMVLGPTRSIENS